MNKVGGVGGRCPVCGSTRVTTEVKRTMWPFVKDSPLVLRSKCRKCGHVCCIPVRTGP